MTNIPSTRTEVKYKDLKVMLLKFAPENYNETRRRYTKADI